MKTYQDLCNARSAAEFIRNAVQEFIASADYLTAKTGEAYYAKHNVTIEKYQKKIYTISGNEVADIFSANYKLKSLFFRRLVVQLSQYILGNGMKVEGKEKLGKDFDNKLQRAVRHAMAAGRSFLFWNHDHAEVMSYVNTDTEPGFCPLPDENTGEVRAGIRFYSKQIGTHIHWFFTLYEEDGYTEYAATDEKDPEITSPKRAYMITRTRTEADGVIEEYSSNYDRLPIVPLYANDTHESELVGVRENIDCYDFIKSGLGNEIDDSSGFYWLLKNAGGMDDADIAQLWQRLKTVHGATVGDEADITLHTVDIPVEARKMMLEILREDIYEDFMILDVKSLSAAQKTTQEIQAAYQSQDDHASDLEYQILDCLYKLLPLAGVTGEPTFMWQKVVNQTEQTQMVLMAADYLSDECVIEHLPFLLPEEIEREKERIAKEKADRYAGETETQEEEDEEGDGGDPDIDV